MGKSFSEVVRESVLERIEAAADLQSYQEALDEADVTTYIRWNLRYTVATHTLFAKRNH